jgi:inosose dehydratase
LGVRVAFHNHSGSYVETREEIARLLSSTSPDLVGLCLDTGHAIVGGVDPVEVVATYGSRVTYLHANDVDPVALDRMRREAIGYTSAVYGDILFTEIGTGQLALPALVTELDRVAFGGWLVVEQDASRLSSEESALQSLVALQAVVAGESR